MKKSEIQLMFKLFGVGSLLFARAIYIHHPSGRSYPEVALSALNII